MEGRAFAIEASPMRLRPTSTQIDVEGSEASVIRGILDFARFIFRAH
jgi:hypothetical protein